MCDPGTDLRRIHLALTHLPMGAWPDPHHAASWSVTDYLLANVIDAVRELTWVTVKVNSDKNAHVQRPDPVPRPGKQQPAAAGKQVRWADLPKVFGAVNGA